MELQSKFKQSDESVDDFLDLMCKTLPEGHKMPANVHECKKYLSDLETPSSKTEGESSKRKRRS
jgi:hypothetical protein